jgi:hypothetical protein
MGAMPLYYGHTDSFKWQSKQARAASAGEPASGHAGSAVMGGLVWLRP